MTLPSHAEGNLVTPRLPDPRSGLVLDTHELRRRAGVMKEIARIAEALGYAGDPLELLEVVQP